MIKRTAMGFGLVAALGLGFALGQIAPGAGTDAGASLVGAAHAQPHLGRRLVSIAVEGGAVYKAYDDDSIEVCSSTPTGVGCRPFR